MALTTLTEATARHCAQQQGKYDFRCLIVGVDPSLLDINEQVFIMYVYLYTYMYIYLYTCASSTHLWMVYIGCANLPVCADYILDLVGVEFVMTVPVFSLNQNRACTRRSLSSLLSINY